MYLLQPLPLTVFGLTLLFAWQDHKYRGIPLWLLLTAAVTGLGICVCGQREFVSILCALIPGILLIFLSFVSGGRLGTGDGAYVCVMGLFFGWQQVCILLMAAFLTAGLTSLGIILRSMMKGVSARGRTLPFLCFMPAGVLAAFCLIK